MLSSGWVRTIDGMARTRSHTTAGAIDRVARGRRDAGLVRVGTVTKSVAVGIVAAVGALGIYVANALPGHTRHRPARPPSRLLRPRQLPGRGRHQDRRPRRVIAADGTDTPCGPGKPTSGDETTSARHHWRQLTPVSGLTTAIGREVVYRIPALGTTAELVLTDPDALVAAAAILRTELDQHRPGRKPVPGRFGDLQALPRCQRGHRRQSATSSRYSSLPYESLRRPTERLIPPSGAPCAGSATTVISPRSPPA